MRLTWTVDAVEDGIASICAGRAVFSLPAELLPAGVREGDVLAVEHEAGPGESILRLRRDPEATAAARDAVRRRLRALGRGDPGGDLAL